MIFNMVAAGGGGQEPVFTKSAFYNETDCTGDSVRYFNMTFPVKGTYTVVIEHFLGRKNPGSQNVLVWNGYIYSKIYWQGESSSIASTDYSGQYISATGSSGSNAFRINIPSDNTTVVYNSGKFAWITGGNTSETGIETKINVSVFGPGTVTFSNYRSSL